MVGSPSAQAVAVVNDGFSQAVAVVNDGFSCIDTGYPCQLMLLEYLRVHLLLLALVYVKGGHMMRCY
jgi:hypothetical protein